MDKTFSGLPLSLRFSALSTLALRAYSFLTCSNSPGGCLSAPTTEQKAAPAFSLPKQKGQKLKGLLGSFVIACALMIASLPQGASGPLPVVTGNAMFLTDWDSQITRFGHHRSTRHTLPGYFQFAQFQAIRTQKQSIQRLKHRLNTSHPSCKGASAWFL